MEALKSVAGLLLGAFASVLTVIGINSGEISSILRNDEWQVLVILLILFVSIVLAFISAVVGTRARWTRDGIVGGLFLVASGYAAVMMGFPLDLTGGWSLARIVAGAIALVLFGVAAYLILKSYGEWRRHDRKSKSAFQSAEIALADALEKSRVQGRAEAQLNQAEDALDSAKANNAELEDRRAAERQVGVLTASKTEADIAARDAAELVEKEEAKISPWGFDLQPWFIVFSGLLLGLAVLGAIRVEARNQQDDIVQVTPSLAAPNDNYDVVTVTVAAPRLTSKQQVLLRVNGIEENGSQASIETVRVRPDATGLAKQTFIVPVSTIQFKEVVGIAQVNVSQTTPGFADSCFTVILPQADQNSQVGAASPVNYCAPAKPKSQKVAPRDHKADHAGRT
jgi:hypothetical protein